MHQEIQEIPQQNEAECEKLRDLRDLRNLVVGLPLD